MKIRNLFPGSWGSNCYLVEDGGEALIIDPSASASAILRAIREDGCTPVGILLTHGHFDHIMSVDTLRQAEPTLKVYIHGADAPMLTDADKNGFAFFFRQERVWNAADILLKDGDEIKVGGATLTVVHTPGHSPGSSCFLSAEAGVMFTGDTLFSDNIGRCDLWNGSYGTLRKSLLSLRSYDGTLTIYPGHGDEERLSRALDNAMYI
ncbi:MAG: MBL fold metallo-hydrolase [Clostridia bacterium]|nr:MBL fold metallo-hydrolase [Clostridia bacterium]